MVRKLLLALPFCFSAVTTNAADCDSLLLTGLDASNSVGAEGMSLEMHGMAEAIISPNVINAIQRSGPRKCVAFAVYLWHDNFQEVIVDWTIIATPEDAALVAMKIKNSIPRAIAVVAQGSLTDISEALIFGRKLLQEAPVGAPRRVLNIAGDGQDNTGELPDRPRDVLRGQGVIINGIVFGTAEDLAQYYREHVTGGPNSFVFRVSKPDQFIWAFTSKFRLDIVGSYELQKGRL